jgi:diguanylate cyclase (GGDEF)-like protein
LYPFLVEKSPARLLAYLASGAAEFGVFLFARRLYKNDKKNGAMYACFFCFFVILMSFGMYIGVLNNSTSYAINFMLFLICAQLLFVFDPQINLMINLVTLAVFAFLSFTFKQRSFAVVDTVNGAAAILIGHLFNWIIARILISKMDLTRKLEEERNLFKEQSIRDELTGLSNRRDFQHGVHFYISVCRHVHQTVCAMMLDVDYFKRYNDHYGHPAGDQVLRSIGKTLMQLNKEESVFAARVGGEEFIVLWTENRIAEAERVARKLNQMIAGLRIPHEKSSVAPYVTVSLGLYVLRGGAPDGPEELYSRADSALYEAKHRGRNCIVLLDSDEKIFRTVKLLPPGLNIGRPESGHEKNVSSQ